MELLPHIKKLIREHDRAFIPEFGGFVKDRIPANLQEGHLFLPPGCTLHFNPQLAKEDSLLFEEVAEAEGIPFDQARERVKTQGRKWKGILEQEDRLELEGIGLLFRDRQGKTRFEPDPDPELDPSSYGLESFIASPVGKKEGVEPEPKAGQEGVATETSLPEKGAGTPKRTLLKAAAVTLPILLLLAYGVGRYQKDGRFLGSLAEHIPGIERIAPRYEARSTKPPSIPSYEEKSKPEPDPPFSFRLKEKGRLFTVVEPTAKKPPGHEEAPPRYLVVGGCFAEERNAKRKVESLKRAGFPARILDRKRKGLHVVIFGGSSERREALTELDRARRQMPEAWLLHRSSL